MPDNTRLIAAIVLLFPFMAVADGGHKPIREKVDGGGAIVYSREKVFIEVEAPLLEKKASPSDTSAIAPSYARSADGSILGDAPKEATPAGAPSPKTEARRYYFDTDVRPQGGMQPNWFYSLENIREGRATMILMQEAGPIPLPEAKLYKPVDVLVIGEDGKILAILPQIVLAGQDKNVRLDMPVKALMYVSGGAAASLHIQPKDSVKYKAFVTDPTVLQ